MEPDFMRNLEGVYGKILTCSTFQWAAPIFKEIARTEYLRLLTTGFRELEGTGMGRVGTECK